MYKNVFYVNVSSIFYIKYVYAKVILEYMNYDSIVIVRKHRTRVHTDYARSHAMAHGQTSYRLDIRRKRPVLLLGRGAAVHAGHDR